MLLIGLLKLDYLGLKAKKFDKLVDVKLMRLKLDYLGLKVLQGIPYHLPYSLSLKLDYLGLKVQARRVDGGITSKVKTRLFRVERVHYLIVYRIW